MEATRRGQLHSCDPCRKGKRGCDAPVCRIALANHQQNLTFSLEKSKRERVRVLLKLQAMEERMHVQLALLEACGLQDRSEESETQRCGYISESRYVLHYELV